jgi:hypothetical protein
MKNLILYLNPQPHYEVMVAEEKPGLLQEVEQEV